MRVVNEYIVDVGEMRKGNPKFGVLDWREKRVELSASSA